jgi:hypothetical protein
MRSSTLPHLSADLAIVKGSVASLKFLSAPLRLVWDWIRAILHHAPAAAKLAGKAGKVELLFDEMDRVLKWLFEYFTLAALHLDKRLTGRHWYMTEIQERGGRDHAETPDVACVAVISDLISYVESKLRLKRISNIKYGRRSLLEYAVCPPINHTMWEFYDGFDGIGVLQASPEMVELLLENGAAPNEAREQRSSSTFARNPGGRTVWQQLLLTGYPACRISSSAFLLTGDKSNKDGAT